MSTSDSSNRPGIYPEVLRLVLQILSDMYPPNATAAEARFSTVPASENLRFFTRWTHLPTVSIMKARASGELRIG